MTNDVVNYADQPSEHELSRSETSSVSYSPFKVFGAEMTTEVDVSKLVSEDVENESVDEDPECNMRLKRKSDRIESEILKGEPVTTEISEVIEEDGAIDYDVEMVLAKQNTHDLFCPNCHSCITKRVILQRRKRKVRFKQRKNRQSSSEIFNAPISLISSSDNVSAKQNDHDDYANLFRCLSCFTFFVRSGTVFEFFGDSISKQTNGSEDESLDSSNWFFSIFSVDRRKARKKSEAVPEFPCIDETKDPVEIREASLSAPRNSVTSATTNSDSPNVTAYDEDIHSSSKSGNGVPEIEQSGTKQPIEASFASAVCNEKDVPLMTSKPSKSSSKRQDGSFLSGIGNGILKIKDSIRVLSSSDKGSVIDSSKVRVSSHNYATEEGEPLSLDDGRKKPIIESEFEDLFSPQKGSMREAASQILSTSGTENTGDFSNMLVSSSNYTETEDKHKALLNGAWNIETEKGLYEEKTKALIPKLQDIPVSNETGKETSKIDDAMRGISTMGREKVMDFFSFLVTSSENVTNDDEHIDNERQKQNVGNSLWHKSKILLSAQKDTPFSSETRKGPIKIEDVVQFLLTLKKKTAIDSSSLRASSPDYVSDLDDKLYLPAGRRKPMVERSFEEKIKISVSTTQDYSSACGENENSPYRNDTTQILATSTSAHETSKVAKEDEQTLSLDEDGKKQLTAGSFEEKGKILPSAVVNKKTRSGGNETNLDSKSLQVSSNYVTNEDEQCFALDGDKKKPTNEEHFPIVRCTSNDVAMILSTSGTEKTSDSQVSSYKYDTAEHEKIFSVNGSWRNPMVERFSDGRYIISKGEEAPKDIKDKLAVVDSSSLFASSPKDIIKKDELIFPLDWRKENPVFDSSSESNSAHQDTSVSSEISKDSAAPTSGSENTINSSNIQVSFAKYVTNESEEMALLGNNLRMSMTDIGDKGDEKAVDFSYSRVSSPKYISNVDGKLHFLMQEDILINSKSDKSKSIENSEDALRDVSYSGNEINIGSTLSVSSPKSLSKEDILLNSISDECIEKSNGALQILSGSGNETDVGSSNSSVSSLKYISYLSVQPGLVDLDSEKPLSTRPDISSSNQMLVSINDPKQVLTTSGNEKAIDSSTFRVSSGNNITTKDEQIVSLDEEDTNKPIINHPEDDADISLSVKKDLVLDDTSKIKDPKLSSSGSKKFTDFSCSLASSSNFVGKEDEQTVLLNSGDQKPVTENPSEDFGTQHYINFVNEIRKGTLKIEDVIKILSNSTDSSNMHCSSANMIINEISKGVKKPTTESASDSKDATSQNSAIPTHRDNNNPVLKSPTSIVVNSDEIRAYGLTQNTSIPKSYQSIAHENPWDSLITNATTNQNSGNLVIDVESASTKATQTEISNEVSLVTCIVYGGLVESITSVGVISSAAGAGASTASTFGLGLANLIGGFFVLCHTLLDLKNDRTTENSKEETFHNRYMVLKALRKNFFLYATVIAVSYAASGALPPVIFGFSFHKSDDRDFKCLTVAASSVVCISLMAVGKTYISGQRNYIQNIIYFVAMAFGASGSSFFVGNLFVRFLQSFGWPESNTVPHHPGWSSFR